MKKVINFLLLCWIICICLWLGVVLADMQKLQTSDQVVAYFTQQLDVIVQLGKRLVKAVADFCQDFKFALFFGQ